MGVKWRKLGELVESFYEHCGDDDVQVSGVDINKQFISTRANLLETDISKYLLVPPRHFACNLMHIGRDERLPVAFNDSEKNLVVTSAYYVFRLKQKVTAEVLDEYLYVYLSRKETDRLTWFFTDSSVRGNLKAKRFEEIEIPVPPVEEQRAVVEVWKGLRKLKEDNEKLAAPLLALCRSYLQDCKKKYKQVELGEYIEECDERNENCEYSVESVRGISIEKKVIETKADMSGVGLKPYKVFKPNEFCYVTVTSRNGGKISLACNETNQTYIVSSSYAVFRVKNCNLLSGYLSLLLAKPEFDRYARFHSWGSARETFSWGDMCRVKIPLPPLEVQQAVVDVYRAANEAKRIAAEADRLSREVCPALIQKVVREVA